MVVYPRNEEDVVKVVEVALEEHVPIVPRGGGVSSAGGITMIAGGIMMDMRSMDRINVEGQEALVEAGAGFKFNARVYPTLWKYATVGGNFCGGSWGIGSMQYGVTWDQVLDVRMVNPKGKVVTLKGGDVKVAAHAEGTTGVVTRLRVLTRADVPITTRVITFDGLEEAVHFTTSLYWELNPLYHMVLRSPEIARISMGPEKWHLILAWEEDKEVDVPGHDGTPIWERRDKFFAGVYAENFQRFDYSTYHLPLDCFGDKLREAVKMGLITEVEFANDFKAHVDFMGGEEIRKLPSLLGKSNFDVEDQYINSRLSKEHLQRILWYKRAYDKEDLFNPGKVRLL